MKELRDLCNGFVYNPQNSILYIHLPKEDKDGKIIPGEFNDISFADFVPKLKEYRITEDCNGNTLEETIFQIEKDGRTLDGLYTVSKKILLSPIPFEPFPASCIVDHQVKGSFAMMRRCMQEEIKQTTPVRYYQFTGYKVIDGERVFLNGENSVTAGGLTGHSH